MSIDVSNITVDNCPTKFSRFAKHLKEVDTTQYAELDDDSKTFFDYTYNFTAVPSIPTSLAGIDASEYEESTITFIAGVASEYAVKTLQVTAGSGAVLEQQSFTIDGEPTSDGDITIDGETIAILDADDAAGVATKIRAHSFTNWTTGGTGADITLTAKTYGDKVDVVLDFGTTGATATGGITEDVKGTTTAGNITITLEGPGPVTVAIADGDDINTVAAAIAAETYTGWTAGVVGDTVTFTCDTYGPKTGSFADTDTTGVTVSTGDLVDSNVGVDASGNVTIALDGNNFVTALAIDDDTPTKVAIAVQATSYTGFVAVRSGDDVTFTAAAYGDKAPDITFDDTDTTGVTGSVSVGQQGFNGVTVTWTDNGPESDSYSLYYITGAVGTEVLADVLAGTEFVGTKNPAGTNIPASNTKVGIVLAGVNEIGTSTYAGPIFVDVVAP
jgi:hypothetical protein